MQNKIIYLYITFLLSAFIDTKLITFVGIVFVTFNATISINFIISSHITTKSSTMLFKYLLFSQIHVLGFQPQFFYMKNTFYTHIEIFHFSIFGLNYMLHHQTGI